MESSIHQEDRVLKGMKIKRERYISKQLDFLYGNFDLTYYQLMGYVRRKKQRRTHCAKFLRSSYQCCKFMRKIHHISQNVKSQQLSTIEVCIDDYLFNVYSHPSLPSFCSKKQFYNYMESCLPYKIKDLILESDISISIPRSMVQPLSKCLAKVTQLLEISCFHLETKEFYLLISASYHIPVIHFMGCNLNVTGEKLRPTLNTIPATKEICFSNPFLSCPPDQVEQAEIKNAIGILSVLIKTALPLSLINATFQGIQMKKKDLKKSVQKTGLHKFIKLHEYAHNPQAIIIKFKNFLKKKICE
ncbi:unnamed protein product [Moneuplotes crassus]|uniref:Uncharacterized protein n=1 Tax=Euplotes crassus TaxID=5936 RepID=A0AAD1XR05_EUPCR|nr:unnamed protein product [Moneuplotes crassus]